MPASTACSSIRVSSSSSKPSRSTASRLSSSWATLLAPDQHRRHPVVAQQPGQRHLGQRLAAGGGHLVQRADVGEALLGEQPGVQRLALGGPRLRGDAVQVAVGQHPLGQRRERDAADALVLEDVEQRRLAVLDPAVEHRVRRLVDQQRRAQLAQDRGRLAGPLRGVRRDAGVRSPGRSGRRCPGHPSSPRAACPGRTGGSRRCRRGPGPSGPATGPGCRAGTCATRRRRTARATCRSPPWSR